MGEQPSLETPEGGDDRGVKVLRVGRRGSRALGDDVVAGPFHGPLALQGVLGGEGDPGEAVEKLQGRQGGVEVSLPGGDEPVAHQVGGADKDCVGRV